MTSTTAAAAAANALRDFTRKWLPRFRDSRQNLHQLLDTGEFHADCAALGYMDDAGEAFDATYPGAFDNLEELDWHLPAVTDASLLGSAVMSKWDQVSHLVSHHFWVTDKARCKAAGHEVRLWFILALERLAQLAGENSSAPLTCQPTALYLISSTHDRSRQPSRSPPCAPAAGAPSKWRLPPGRPLPGRIRAQLHLVRLLHLHIEGRSRPLAR